MKLVPVILALALMLTGCAAVGSNEREEILDIRAKYIAQPELSLRAELTADYGERVYVYELDYAGDASAGTIQVYSPQIISGISAVYQQGCITLRFDGAILDTGKLSFGMCPLEAFPFMINAWQNGYISECWHENYNGTDSVAAQIEMGDADMGGGIVCRVWFDRSDGGPLFCEIAENGKSVIQCKFLKSTDGQNV